MPEIRETFMAGDRHYEIRLRSGAWYELWCDGRMVDSRNEWPIDPETQEPYVGGELLRVTTEICVAAENLPWKAREREAQHT